LQISGTYKHSEKYSQFNLSPNHTTDKDLAGSGELYNSFKSIFAIFGIFPEFPL